MVLRLDPRLPLVWRSPTSLQLGISRPVVVLEKASDTSSATTPPGGTTGPVCSSAQSADSPSGSSARLS